MQSCYLWDSQKLIQQRVILFNFTDFHAIGAGVLFFLEFLPRKEWRKSINSVEVPRIV